MKKTLTAAIVSFFLVASLHAGLYDSERPSWAPIEPDTEVNPHKSTEYIHATSQLERDLKRWASIHQVVSQYDPKGLDRTFIVGAGPNRVACLAPTAPNILTEEEQAEVDSLNRRVEIANLEREKRDLELPRRDLPEEPVVDQKQDELDTIDELKESIASLQQTLEEQRLAQTNTTTVEEDDSFSTPVVASVAGLAGVSLASLLGLAFAGRREVVS